MSEVDLARRRGASIGDDVVLRRGSALGRRCAIGDHTHFSGAVTVAGGGHCAIGRWNAIGVELRVLTSNHVMTMANMHGPLQAMVGPTRPWSIASDVSIGSATWIGDRVTILAGTEVGHGAVIGAGSVVRGVIEPFTIAAGVPARPLRSRFTPEVVTLLLETSWWDWPDERLRRNRDFFEADLAQLPVRDIQSLIV